MKMFLVQGDHFHIPGRQMSLHASEASASIDAAAMVNHLLEWVKQPQDAKPETWEADLVRALNARALELECDIEDIGSDGADVWITELLVRGMGDPVGWSYELACAFEPRTCEYGLWEKRLSPTKPQVPNGAVRNLRPVYAGEVEPG
jgi:hypothetical protein